jgi:hypothetical protein
MCVASNAIFIVVKLLGGLDFKALKLPKKLSFG